MKLICDGPAEHLKINQKNCTATGDPHNYKYQYHQLTKSTTDTDTEDELKAPLLSINQRLNEILSNNSQAAADLQSYAPRHKFCPFPSRRDINHRLSIWYA